MTLSVRTAAIGAAVAGVVAAGSFGFARAGGHSGKTSPPAVYGTDPAAPLDDPLALTAAAPSHRVSVSFSNAPVKQVLDWLRKQDENFVVASSSYNNDLRITLNAKDEPLSTVEHAIAEAMGGSWAKRDGMLVFRKGGGLPFEIADGGTKVFTLRDNGDWAKGDDKTLQLKLRELDKLGDQFGPEFEQKFEKAFGPEFQKKLELNFGPEFEKKMQDQFGPEFQKKLEQQFGPEFQKKMQDQFGPEFQKRLELQFGPEFQKKMQDQFGPEFQKRMEEQAKEFKGQRLILRDQDLDGLLNSLTDDQKATMKRKGYLTPKDLNEKQKKMLGPVGGKFEMKVKTDKGEMTIKSE